MNEFGSPNRRKQRLAFLIRQNHAERVNELEALKLMTWRHESQAEDPEEYAAIVANKAQQDFEQEKDPHRGSLILNASGGDI